MKKQILFLLMLPFISMAQILVPDSSSINFGDVMVGDTDSVQINITNTTGNPVTVTNIKFYTIYDEFPFSALSTSFTIPANATAPVRVYFSPIQNVLNNSVMVIQHNASSGHEAIELEGQGKFPLTYYNSTENLDEEPLKTALKTRTGQGYNQLSYNAARDAMFMTIDNKMVNGQGANVNTLECVYTGYNKTGYSSRSNAQSTSPQFNTEHTFPQGFFNSNLPMRSDIHHLYPTTNNSNSQRGNKPFGIVTNGTPVTLGGGSFYNNTTFEPRNAQKGMTARAMMYFVIRYQDYSNHFSGQENILRSWHNNYPVTTIESTRNDDIFTVQNNRNPFVDYPQLEKRITNFVTNSVAPVQYGMDVLQTAVDFGTVATQQADTFDYVLVNRGNQIINISNLALSNTSFLSFASGSGSNSFINPGDALEISVVAQPTATGNFNENLTFNTNIPGSQSSFTIPVRGNAVIVSLGENQLLNQLEVFPNPLQDQLYVRAEGNHNLTIRLFDLLGKEKDLRFLNQKQNNYIISTKELKKGIYFLEVTEGNETVVKKLVK